MMLLRGVRDEDLDILFEHQNEPAASQMAAFPPRDRDSFYRHWRSNVLPNETAVTKVIELDGVSCSSTWRARCMPSSRHGTSGRFVSSRNVDSRIARTNARAALLTHGEDGVVLELSA